MAILVKCPTCSYSTHAADSQSGKIAKCPKCQNLIHIPDITWVGEIDKEDVPPPFTPPIEEVPVAPAITKPVQPLITSTQAKLWIKRAMVSVSGLMFLVTLRQPGMAGLSHYIALMILAGFLFHKLLAMAPGVWRQWGTIAAVILTVILWWRSDYSIRSWQRRSEANNADVHYDDYIYRGSWKPFYRRYWHLYDDGESYSGSGGLSESHKPHGQWDYSEPGNPHSSWYWYGEEITEGEWHLRNK